MFARVLWSALAVIAVATAGALAQNAPDQNRQRTIWDLKLGAHALELPRSDYGDFACGTNGGPPSLMLRGWVDYGKCAADPDSHLHEVYFRYDDEQQYINLAQTPGYIVSLGTTEFELPVIASALFDDLGFLEGIRLVTDPRTDLSIRAQGDNLFEALKIRFGNDGWICADLPKLPGETPYRGSFNKVHCEKTDAAQGVRYRLEQHYYRRAGEKTIDPVTKEPTTGQFVSLSRFEEVLVNGVPNSAARAAAIKPPPPSPSELLAQQALNCSHCDLHGANLKRASLHGAQLQGADLTNADLHAVDLSGADLTGAKLAGANLNRSDLRQAKLAGADISGAMLYGARLGGADLANATLTDIMAGTAQMMRVHAPGASAAGADLRGALMTDADFSGADLTNAILHGARLTRIDFERAKLDRAQMWRTVLSAAHLMNVDARGADFTGSDLRNADLSSGDFSAADLSDTMFGGVQAAAAKFDGATLPAGFPH